MSVTVLSFSPNGTTRTIAEHLGKALGDATCINLTLPQARVQTHTFSQEDTVVVAFPSYYDRLPLANEILPRLIGNGARAVGLTVFGNNHYETARSELHSLLAGRGFQVMALGCFVAAHCMLDGVAAGRPNTRDFTELDAFASAVAEKLSQNTPALTPPVLDLPPFPASPLCVTGDDRCIRCNTCVGICPVDAIDHDRPMDTDADRCILCHRCAHLCPVNCRTVHAAPFHARMTELKDLLSQSDKANEVML